MAILAFDEHTVALYRLNESTVAGTGYSTAVDIAAAGGLARNLAETGNDPLGTVTSSHRTHIVNGPNRNGYARWFGGGSNNARMTRAGDATGASTFKGDLTFEAWINPTLSNATGHKIFTYADPTIDTEVGNYLFALLIRNVAGTYYLETFWEAGAGVDVVTTSSAVIVADTWQHVAVTVDNAGGTATIKFYVDGDLKSTHAGVTKATGGTAASVAYHLGYDPGTSLRYHGAVKDVRISTVVRSDGEIAADAASATYQHSLDGNTFILWRLNEAPDAIEESPYGYHARLASGTIEIVDPLIPDGGRARHMDAATEYHAHAGFEPFRLMLTGDWTFECWLRLDTGYADEQRGAWLWGNETSETQENNGAHVGFTSDRKALLMWEHNTGLNNIKLSTNPILAQLQDGYNIHSFAFTRYWNGATWMAEFFIDGVLFESGAVSSNNYDGGTASWLRLGKGGGDGQSAVGFPLVGVIDEMRWSNVRRTDEELDVVVGPCAIPPVIALVSPPEGEMDASVPIVIRATDDQDDLIRVRIFFGGQLAVNWTPATTWTAPEFALTSVAPITLGQEFTIQRSPTWLPGALYAVAIAEDGSGLEGTRAFEWTVRPASATRLTLTERGLGEVGRDIWLDVTEGDGADRYVTAKGDWKLAADDEALRQSLLRRIVTNPGEWATLPEYGVGARRYVKARNTQANRDELATRIREQCLRDRRVVRVEKVSVELTGDVVKLAVVVTPKSHPQRAHTLAVIAEVT